MTIIQNNHEDHRNVTITEGMTIEIKIGETIVYTRTVTAGKNANIAFQLQEVNAPEEAPE